jgi:hypothetical protein
MWRFAIIAMARAGLAAPCRAGILGALGWFNQAFAGEVEFGEFSIGFGANGVHREWAGHSPLATVYGIKAARWTGTTDRIFAT